MVPKRIFFSTEIITKMVFSNTDSTFMDKSTRVESPPEIINKIDTHSLQGFSKYIKIKILESYNEDCTLHNCYICNINL